MVCRAEARELLQHNPDLTFAESGGEDVTTALKKGREALQRAAKEYLRGSYYNLPTFLCEEYHRGMMEPEYLSAQAERLHLAKIIGSYGHFYSEQGTMVLASLKENARTRWVYDHVLASSLEMLMGLLASKESGMYCLLSISTLVVEWTGG